VILRNYRILVSILARYLPYSVTSFDVDGQEWRAMITAYIDTFTHS
jgi:hypothetical protein